VVPAKKRLAKCDLDVPTAPRANESSDGAYKAGTSGRWRKGDEMKMNTIVGKRMTEHGDKTPAGRAGGREGTT